MITTHLVCNRLVKEDWEDREYAIHLKKISDIKNRKSNSLSHGSTSNSSSTSVKFPHIFSNPKKALKLQEQKYEAEKELNSIEQRINRIKAHGGSVDHKNPYYEKTKNREVGKNKFKIDIEAENVRLGKKIANAKGMYNSEQSIKEYENHRSHLKLSSKKYYTPRGMGYRKTRSLPEVRKSNKKNKNTIKLLNEAVNQLERADVVLMKTLVNLNYLERMETKRKYEESYVTDLKKGLLKVIDKQYEPLVQALLTDTDVIDVDRIYESLYDPAEAATIITECFIVRNLEQKSSLLLAFHQKIDSELKSEILSKIEGDLKPFLLAFLENDNLDNNHVDESKLKKDLKSLENITSFTSSSFLNVIKFDSKKQLKKLFDEYQTVYKTDIFAKIDTNKPTYKAVKLIQSYLANSNLYSAEKLQKTLKTNKSEFLRILATYSQKELDNICKEYNHKYQTSLDDDIKSNFPNDVSKLILKIVHKNSMSEEETYENKHKKDNDDDDDDENDH